MKFTERGEVVLTVESLASDAGRQDESAARHLGPDGQLHFSIRDTGLGIPADKQALLFQAFSQLDASTSRRYGGTGLGLVISQRLVQRMGGNLWVESEGVPGRGSTFHFTLPAAMADPSRAAAGSLDQRPGRPQSWRSDAQAGFDRHMAERMPLRILLAEDNVINQLVALRVLERLGYHAHVAGNGREALEAVRAQPYDVVLMDVQMPEMDGLEATRRIRAERPAADGPRIIAMTANAMQGDREACLAAGMEDYVSKPIRLNELVEALSRCQPHAEAETPLPPPDAPPHIVPGMLDPAALRNLRLMADGDDAVLAGLMDTYFKTAGELFGTLRQAVEQGDAAALCLAAHSLKSNSESFGALALGDLCRGLEAQGRSGALQGAAEGLAGAEAEYARVRLALEVEQRRLQPAP